MREKPSIVSDFHREGKKGYQLSQKCPSKRSFDEDVTITVRVSSNGSNAIYDAIKQLLVKTLELANRNQESTAKALGISIRTIRNYIKLYNIRNKTSNWAQEIFGKINSEENK